MMHADRFQGTREPRLASNVVPEFNLQKRYNASRTRPLVNLKDLNPCPRCSGLVGWSVGPADERVMLHKLSCLSGLVWSTAVSGLLLFCRSFSGTHLGSQHLLLRNQPRQCLCPCPSCRDSVRQRRSSEAHQATQIYMRLRFGNGVQVHLSLSWIWKKKKGKAKFVPKLKYRRIDCVSFFRRLASTIRAIGVMMCVSNVTVDAITFH